MVLLSKLYSHLDAYPGLLQSCSLKQLDFFLRLCRHFRAEIELHSPVTSLDPPHRLPLYLNTFLSETLYLDSVVILQLWDALKCFLWLYDIHYERPQISVAEISLINSAGRKTVHKKEMLGVSYYFNLIISFLISILATCMFYPPTRQCRMCDKQLRLSSLMRHSIVFFSVKNGLDAQEGYATSLACAGTLFIVAF